MSPVLLSTAIFDAAPAVSDIQAFVPTVGTFLLACVGLMILAAVVWVLIDAVRNR